MQNKTNQVIPSRRCIYLSSDDMAEPMPDKWTRVINTPDIDERYRYVSLINATIPNKIPTIQDEVNNKWSIEFEWFEWDRESSRPPPGYSDWHKIIKEYTLEEKNYTGDEILNYFNDIFRSFTFTSLIPESINTTPYQNDKNQIIWELDDNGVKTETPGNAINFYKDKIHLKFCAEVQIRYGHFYISTFAIHMPNRISYLLGINKMNYHYDFFRRFVDQNGSTASKQPILVFEGQPSVVWLQVVQIRSDWVNSDENSNVLANIPITKNDDTYITFTNPQIDYTSRKMQTHHHTRMKIKLTNQDGYTIDLSTLPIYFEFLIY